MVKSGWPQVVGGFLIVAAMIVAGLSAYGFSLGYGISTTSPDSGSYWTAENVTQLAVSAAIVIGLFLCGFALVWRKSGPR